MATQTIKEQHIFVVDTNEYAGNFERHLCAYVTGRIGDCEVGDELIEIFEKEVGDPDEFFDFIESEPDEHGCRRPVTIVPTPGWFNDGRGGQFRDGEENKAQEYKKTNKEWKGREDEELTKWPCYNSVGIFYDKCEGLGYSEEKIQLMKERSRKFFETQKVFGESQKHIKIESFRIVKQITTQETIYLEMVR